MLARQMVLLTSSASFHPTQLLSRQQPTPVSPLAATLMDFPASVANKRLTAELSPLDATLTKNRGAGGVSVNQLPPVPAFRRSNIPTRLQPSFVLNRLHTLSFSVSCNSFTCHSYENNRVCANNSHSGAQRPPLHLEQRFDVQTCGRSDLQTNKLSPCPKPNSPGPPPLCL